MKKYEIILLDKFKNFDITSKDNIIKSFKNLWQNENIYKKHLDKRLKMGHINNDIDYAYKTIKCMADTKECLIANYYENDIWDRIRYFDNNEWIVIFAENGILLTSHKKEEMEMSFELKHKKFGAKIIQGEIDEKFREFFKCLQNEFRLF